MISLKALGLTTAAARLPTALATCAAVALTFLIGDRLGGPWRGFLAGLIHLCACGTFLLGRIIMPEPLLSVFIAAALYCAIRGYERRAGRRAWFVGFWICAALACMTKGFHGLLYPAAVLLLLSCFYREARIRFAQLFRLEGIARFPAPRLALASLDGMAAPGILTEYSGHDWFIHLAGAADRGHTYETSAGLAFAALHLAWWFPWTSYFAGRAARHEARVSSARNGDSLTLCRSAGWRLCWCRYFSSGNDRTITR